MNKGKLDFRMRTIVDTFLAVFIVIAISGCSLFGKSVSADEVQAMIDMASAGDVVNLPAGESTWTETVHILGDKKVTIRGAGAGATQIYVEQAAFALWSQVYGSGSRITGIEFVFPDNAFDNVIEAQGQGWRVDHCTFRNTGTESVRALAAVGSSSDEAAVGLFDHNIVFEARVVVNGDASLLAHGIWSEPLGLGSNNAVFVEDNEFYRTHGNVVDSQYGGRYVFRYNYVEGGYVEAHSVQDYDRGVRSWEIYENEIVAVGETAWFVPVSLRGGTGVVFNNRISGFRNASSGISNNVIRLDNMRSFHPRVEDFESGWADGTSPFDMNTGVRGTGVASAWPTRDQIGRSTDNEPWDPNASPHNTQSWFPAHAWNNTNELGEAVLMVVSPDMSNPDYQGVTNHILGKADIPGSPNFVYDPDNEDNNTTAPLSVQYDFANEELVGYVPYQYPHPLQQ
jgi:hypothetical protein